MKIKITPFWIAAILFTQYAFGETLSEANVFEWWDDGIINQEEAEELLNILEEGNTQEACILAESYAQVNCSTEKIQPSGAEIFPHGHFLWKGRMDSTGHLAKHYEKLQLSFYHYTIKLGSHNLLSYERENYEALFGELSTNDLHSFIPTDTLWGTALRIPIHNFRFGAMLDTAINMQGQISYIIGKGTHIDALLWKSEVNMSGALQFAFPGFKISTWFQPGESFPLIKFQTSEKTSKKEIQKNEGFFSFTRSTNIYIHGTSIPDHAMLSSSILKNKLWLTQSFSLTSLSKYNITFTGNIRANSPLDADTLSNRIQTSIGMGPKILHAGITTSCTEVSEKCPQSFLKFSASSLFEIEEQTIQIKGSAKIQSTKQISFSKSAKEPRLETSISYSDKNAGKAKISVIFPKANPSEITTRGEISIDSKYFESSFIIEFAKKEIGEMHPNKAFLQAKLNF